MMPYLTYDNCVIEFVKILRKISGLNKSLVLNADSLRGAQAGNTVYKKIFEASPSTACFIIFEFIENTDATSQGVSPISNKLSEVLTTYIARIKVYGLKSHDLTYQLLAGFKSSSVATDAREAGIYIAGTSTITPVNEFINSTLWLRCDFDVTICCKHQIDLSVNIPTADKEVVSIKNLNIITK